MKGLKGLLNWRVLVPVGIGMLFLGICVLNLTQPIWFDESFTAYLSRFEFGEIWELTATDVHPPLYYFLVKIWVEIFGNTDVAFRLFSAFCGAVALLFAYLWLKRSFGLKIAAVAGVFMAISPIFVRYGEEARMYTLAAAIIFGATYCLSVALERRKLRFWLIYGVLMALGMWTHYFTALMFMAQLLYVGLTYKKKFLREMLVAVGLAVLLYLPWLPIFVEQMLTVQGGFWIGPTTPVTIADYLTYSTMYRPAEWVSGWLTVLVLAIVAMSVWLVPKAWRENKVREFRLLTFMAFVPAVILLILSLPPLKPMFLDRYLVYSSMCLFAVIVVAALTVKLRKVWMRVVPLGLLLVAGVIGIVNINTVTPVFPSERDVYADLVVNEVGAATELPLVVFGSEGDKTLDDLSLYLNLAFYQEDAARVWFYEPSFDYLWNSHDPLKKMDLGKIRDVAELEDLGEEFWYVSVYDEAMEPVMLPAGTGYDVAEIRSYEDKYMAMRMRKN